MVRCAGWRRSTLSFNPKAPTRVSITLSILSYLCAAAAAGSMVAGQGETPSTGTEAAQAPASERIFGRILEACSCSVPCPCNFGGRPNPHWFCDSLAFFEFQGGEIDKVALAGLHFAFAERSGNGATLYLDTRLSEAQRRALRRVANWILSLDGTPLVAVLTGPITIEFGQRELRASVAETDLALKATPLRGNDGVSALTVSRPWIFGPFPVTSSRKCVARTLHARAPGLSFDYGGTNANDAVFEFLPSQVR